MNNNRIRTEKTYGKEKRDKTLSCNRENYFVSLSFESGGDNFERREEEVKKLRE